MFEGEVGVFGREAPLDRTLIIISTILIEPFLDRHLVCNGVQLHAYPNNNMAAENSCCPISHRLSSWMTCKHPYL